VTGHTLASSNDPSSFEDVYDSAGMSMTCFGSINNVKTEMLLDTGSVFSIINYDLYKTINQRSVIEMTISPFISRIISANNESIEIFGSAEVKINIDGNLFVHKILIAKDLAHSCLLGTDFMKRYNVDISFSNMSLKIGGKTCNLNLATGSTAVCRILLKQTTCIPPGHEILVEGKVKKLNQGISVARTYIFEPKKRFSNSDKVCAARVLTDRSNKCVL
jgi:hypothetical protein